jgi:histone arginine demethylase JMJD6
MNMAHIFRVSPVEVCKRDSLERVSASTLSTEEFIERYEKEYKPVIITDAQARWPATEKWTLPVTNYRLFPTRVQ